MRSGLAVMQDRPVATLVLTAGLSQAGKTGRAGAPPAGHGALRPVQRQARGDHRPVGSSPASRPALDVVLRAMRPDAVGLPVSAARRRPQRRQRRQVPGGATVVRTLTVEFVKITDRSCLARARRLDGAMIETTATARGGLPHDLEHLLV